MSKFGLEYFKNIPDIFLYDMLRVQILMFMLMCLREKIFEVYTTAHNQDPSSWAS